MSYSPVEAKPLQQLCKIIDCEHKTAPYVEKSEFLVVRTSNIRNGQLLMEDMKYTTLEGFVEWTQRATPEYGDVLFTREAPAGESCLVPKNQKVCIGQRMVLLRPNTKKIDPLFLSLILATEKSKFDILRLSIGSTVSRINIADIKKLKVAAPPLTEQKKIAQILSTWDKAIATTEKLLENSQKQKQALMQQLLTGKKRFSGFNDKWLTKSLGEIGEIRSAGVDKNIVKDEQPVRLLNFTDVFNRSFIYSEELNHWVTAPDAKVLSCNVKKGDVFFTPSSETRDEVAIPAVAAEDINDCCYSYHVVRFRLQENWDLNFKAYIFTTPEFRKQAYMLADGSGQRYVISQDGFRSIKITYPTYQEQVLIGKALKAAEDEVNLLKQKITYLKEEKKALMQQLLTGKRRVRVN